MGSAVTMTIPAFLRYDLREVDGDWKVATLRAYWELPAMVLQFLRNGASAVPATVQLSQGLIRNQRLRGTAGFVAGFRRVGSRQKTLVDTFVNAVGRGDRFGALQALSSGATITFGDDEKADVAELIERCSGASAAKLIAAGSTVAASVTSGTRRGVLFADVARRGTGIHRVRYFPSDHRFDDCLQPGTPQPDRLRKNNVTITASRRPTTNTSLGCGKPFDRRTLLRGAGCASAPRRWRWGRRHAALTTMH